MAERRAPCARSPGPGPGSGSRSSCDLRQRLQNTLHIAGSRAQGDGSRLGSGGSSRPAQGKLPVPQIGSGGGGKAATSLSQPTTLASSLPKANRSVVGSGDAETPKVNRSVVRPQQGKFSQVDPSEVASEKGKVELSAVAPTVAQIPSKLNPIRDASSIWMDENRSGGRCTSTCTCTCPI